MVHKMFSEAYNTDHEHMGSTSEIMGRLWPYLEQFKLHFVLIIVLGIATAAMDVLSIGALYPLFELIISGKSVGIHAENLGFPELAARLNAIDPMDQVRLLALMVVVIQILREGLAFASARITSVVQTILNAHLRQSVYNRLVNIKMAYYMKKDIATLFSMLNNFTSSASNMCFSALSIAPSLIVMAAYSVVLFYMSWELTLLTAACAVLVLFIINIMVKRQKYWSTQLRLSAVELNHEGYETLSALKQLKAFGREDHAIKGFQGAIKNFVRANLGQTLMKDLMVPLQMVVSTLMLAVIIIAGTYMLSLDTSEWAEITMLFTVILLKLIRPVAQVNNHRGLIASNLSPTQSLVDFMEETADQEASEGHLPLDSLDTDITFKDVSFSYDQNETILNKLNFTIKKGEFTALVGGSGAGKTTIVSLLLRMYDPTEGAIMVNGEKGSDIQLKEWRKKMALVSQDIFLFNDTARENIRFGRLDATDAEIIEAAKRANAHEFLQNFKEGYDTHLGDRGVRLSGGQAQRIALARAFLADPEILILDEATSAQDSKSERAVQEAIESLQKDASKERTLIVIAHRLSTIKKADTIIVLEKGRVIEQGSHSALYKKKAKYYEYVRLQNLNIEATDTDLKGEAA